MLVLSRRKNEDIVINNGEITVRVVEIRGDKVRLGIIAPKEIPVHRLEVHEQIMFSKVEPATITATEEAA